MKEVWAIQIDLLAQLEKVCKKYGLKYYADSGTLLGAVRHRGYIPWVDDIDVVMSRKDYDQLIKIGSEAFSNPYFLQSAYSDEFIRGFARLRNSQSTAIGVNDVRLNCNKGVFIDILPLDGIPKNQILKQIWIKALKVLFITLRVGVNSSPRYYNSLKDKVLCVLLNN